MRGQKAPLAEMNGNDTVGISIGARRDTSCTASTRLACCNKTSESKSIEKANRPDNVSAYPAATHASDNMRNASYQLMTPVCDFRKRVFAVTFTRVLSFRINHVYRGATKRINREFKGDVQL